MSYEVTLLVFGILLLLVGLVGQVRAKELEVGTSNPIIRVVTGLVGTALIGLSVALTPLMGILFPPSEPPVPPEPTAPGIYLNQDGRRGDPITMGGTSIVFGETDGERPINFNEHVGTRSCLIRDVQASRPLEWDDFETCP